MDNRKNSKRHGRRLEKDKKSRDVSEKYSDSLIALNESSFKIRRFMNDVGTYKGSSISKIKKTRHESESKDKENVDPKSSLAVKKEKRTNRHETRGKGDAELRATFAFQGKKGLFENGVATKTRTYSRGLMPPMWNARLNADLRSILNLACVDAPKRHATSTSVAEPIDNASESLCSRSPDATLINSRLALGTEKKTVSSKKQQSMLSDRVFIVSACLDTLSESMFCLIDNAPESLCSRSPDATLINSRLALRTEKKTISSKQSKNQLHSIFNDDDSLVRASCSQVGLAEREPVAESGCMSDVVSRAADDVPEAAPKSELDSGVNYSDHYLRFTHFIIKSLSSVRIDRDELENSSKEPVRFLAEFYRERLAQASEEQKAEESPSFATKDVFQSMENVHRSQPTCSQPAQSCANTVRSDEWPRISRMKAQADEQLFDDTNVRKSKIYTSGLELLESVYGQNNSTHNQKTFTNLSVTPPKCIFSPISGDNVGPNSSFVNPVSGKKDWLPDFKSYSPPVRKSCYDYQPLCCSNHNTLDFMVGDDYANPTSCKVINCGCMTCGDDYVNPSSSLRYWPGLSGRSCSLNKSRIINDDGRMGKTYSTMDRSSGKMPVTTTADCLTILPPKSRRLDQWKTSRGSYGVETKFRMNVDDSENALLTLPLRPPARESPDIQYYPRRMF